MCDRDGVSSSLEKGTRELTNEVSAESDEEGAIRYSPKAKIRSCSDNGAPGSPVGVLLSAVGALKPGANGQGWP